MVAKSQYQAILDINKPYAASWVSVLAIPTTTR
jgi:hypothetical protein